MSDYTKTTDFAAKDLLPSGNINKVIVGTEIDDEFNDIATAVNSKYDSTNDDVANGVAALDGTALIAPAVIPAATTAAVGGLETATNAEAAAEAATDKIVTPSNFAQNAGVVGDALNLTDPGADRIGFWDDSAGAFTWLAAGTNLNITATTISAPTATLEAAINHDNLVGFVTDEHVAHSGVTLTAGSALSGGGNIAASRSFAVDISGLTSLDAETMAAADTFLIDDGDGGTNKKIAYRDFGPAISASSTFTLGVDDANTVVVNTGATDHTITVDPEGTTAYNNGYQVAFCTQSTGTITIAEGAGVTINSLNSYLQVKASGGGAYLVKTGTNVWQLLGDLEA